MPTRSFSDHCAYLGCPLMNSRWSWCALSSTRKRAVFTVWADEVKGRTYVLHPVAERRPGEIPSSVELKLGAVESERIAKQIVADPSIEAFGILCYAKEPKAEHRQRQTFDDDTVMRLRLEESGGKIVAHFTERVDVKMLV